MFFSDWGLIPYAEAWQRQTEWFDSLIQAKQNNDVYENHIVFCEHPHVYTLGRSGKENNMLLSKAQLEKIGATLYHIDRGGDITYHGPGQLVCYPILNLEEFGLGLKEYVHLLEEGGYPRVCLLWNQGGKAGKSHRCVVGRRYCPGTQDLCDRSKEQPLCHDAWPCLECEYRLTLFQLHPSLRIYRQRRHFTAPGTGRRTPDVRSEATP